MELKMESTRVACLEPVVRETQNQEQTQELRLGDGMPDIGRVLAAWGQPVLRGKEWRTGSISASGGMMVWVLYAPEDGSGEQWLETWIPFQMKWEVPEDKPDGVLRLEWLPRFVDARSVSPRKIMVRCGLGCAVEAYIPAEAGVKRPISSPPDVQLLRQNYPVRLPKEAGEKSFLLDEELTPPEELPRPEKIVRCGLTIQTAEKKVLTNRLLFRGSGALHVLYRGEDEKLHAWDTELPFSQYADLDGEYGTDAQADIQAMVTSLEPELDESGRLRVKCGAVGQYVITDREILELIQDAYSPTRELQIEFTEEKLPAVLEETTVALHVEQVVPGEAASIVDVSVLPDLPRYRQGEDGDSLESTAAIQVLYYGEDEALHASTAKWEERHPLKADPSCRITVFPTPMGPFQTVRTGDGSLVRGELALEQRSISGQGIPTVSKMELGEEKKPDPGRPSLILCRRGKRKLWDVAKASGSTVDAIRRANHLTDEPAENQMLLIPIQ